MTSKTKLTIFSVVGIAALAAFASVLMVDNTTTLSTIDEKIVEATHDKNAVPLHEREHRSGIAVMDSIEIENPNLEVLTFQELPQGEYDFIWRAINNGATFVSDEELKTYSEEVKEPNHRFTVTDENGITYYRISIDAPPLRYDQHYIKVLEFAEERDIAFKQLPENSRLSIAEQIDRPYRWIPVDESSAISLKDMTERDGTFFTSTNQRGQSNFQIQYLGPLGDEFQKQEFKQILAEIEQQHEEKGIVEYHEGEDHTHE
ncbi:MAG: hypothetical protein IS860_06255 [Nitrosopumilus sp.]|nr:hypothetical protein [Nitrosopumilus sp.]